MNQKLKEKIQESVSAILPITIIVALLCVTITPMPLAPLMLFMVGAVLLTIGMGFFTLGAEIAMQPIGEAVGKQLTKSRKVWLIVVSCFFIGMMITIAEPDLQVLATQTPAVPDMILILSVAVGVGFFLAIAFLREMFGWNLRTILLACYTLIFVLAAFVPREFLSVAFDSGGVTTGPITVPFLMSLGIGITAMNRSKDAESDSFGLVALCSAGPIIAVLILGYIFGASAGDYTPVEIPEIENTKELSREFIIAFPVYLKEVLRALIPIAVFFGFMQVLALKLRRRQVIRIIIGLLYTLVGLVLFLTSVNVGFMPVGNYLGRELAALDYYWILVPLGMIIGYYIVKAEPAVIVLNKQVEDITGGAISAKTMMLGLSTGMAIAVGLSMVRVITGISVLWVLVPGYALALILTFKVPKIFTSIAFDSGGVASGPMTATFLLPFAMGACESMGGNILTDAFGIVAIVAMTPLVVIQILGIIYQAKTKKAESRIPVPVEATDDIIELGEEEDT